MDTTTDTPPTEQTPQPLAGPIVPPNTVREKTLAKYTFTVEEIGELGRSLQGARRDYQRIEEELNSVKAEYKSKLTAAELEQDKFGRKLDDGFEMRGAFAVVTFNDPSKGRKTYRHEDTAEFIKDEAMTISDWQLPMFRTPDGKDATEPAAAVPVNADVVPETAADRQRNKEGATEFLSTEGEGTKEDLGGILDVPNAGKTPLGAALDAAAVKTDLPQFVIAGFESKDWNPGTLMKAASLAARKAGWPEPAISTLRAGLFAADGAEAMQALLRAHVVAGVPSLEELFAAAVEDDQDGSTLRKHFSRILAAFPESYPGGNSEDNFRRFNSDVAEAKLAKPPASDDPAAE